MPLLFKLSASAVRSAVHGGYIWIDLKNSSRITLLSKAAFL